MINDLYQETILDHSKRPRNFQLLEDANRKAEGYNPLCGDRCKVFVKEHGGVIDNVTFQGAVSGTGEPLNVTCASTATVTVTTLPSFSTIVSEPGAMLRIRPLSSR